MPAPLASTSCQRFVPAYVADLRTASWAPDQLYEDFVMGLTWWGGGAMQSLLAGRPGVCLMGLCDGGPYPVEEDGCVRAQ